MRKRTGISESGARACLGAVRRLRMTRLRLEEWRKKLDRLKKDITTHASKSSIDTSICKVRGVIPVKLRSKILIYVLSAVILGLFASLASAAELQLVGVKLGSPVSRVLTKYGNPNDVRVGGAAGGGMGQRGMMGAPAGVRGTGPVGPMGMVAGPGAMGPMMGAMAPGAMGPGLMGPGAMGPRGPMGGRGMMGPGRQLGAPQQQQQQQAGQQVTWVYKFAKGRTMELLINPDGIVVQITVYGSNWPSVRTTKGIKLGSTYKDLIMKYGYPESQAQQGVQLLVKYQKKNRVVFTTIGRTVVGITIAL